MKLVFMGSGAFAVPSLEALLDSDAHDVTALITQPDKPAGRGHRMTPPPTKPLAEARGIAVHQPAKVRDEASLALVRALAPDCVVVVAYGQIIPKTILAVPPKGIINVHASLLPLYRGAAPIQWAIANGETHTGVTTMLMDEGLDTGPILQQETTSIEPDQTSASLSTTLSRIGAHLLLRTLGDWERGALEPTTQDDSRKSLAPMIRKEHAKVEWSMSASRIDRMVRAFIPWPVAFTTVAGGFVKIWKTSVVDRRAGQAPGTVLSIAGAGIEIACGEDSVLLVTELQPSGKARMPGASFAHGRRLASGAQIPE